MALPSLFTVICISSFIILQVLLSQVHRLRALDLLGRFLDLGPWAVSLVSTYDGLWGGGVWKEKGSFYKVRCMSDEFVHIEYLK